MTSSFRLSIALKELSGTRLGSNLFNYGLMRMSSSCPGLPYLTNMYQRGLLVATGSGICVFLSFLLQQPKTDVHIIWIAKKIRESYGDGIWEAVKDMPSEKLTLIDTALSGRPKTRELVVTKAKQWSAEVVIVTSNPRGTNEIVNGCKDVGIPAFGPIWDS